MMNRTEFTFGYDIENVQEVENYVRENYSSDEYEMIVGLGDDTMNALEIDLKKGDERLMELIFACDGSGEFSEE